MSDKNVVSIKNLSKSYKLDNGHEVQALKNISLDVKEGEILGVIGTSGSGKSTLLRILRGVEEFDEGEVTVGRYTLKPDSTKYFFNQVKRETAIHLQRSFGIWPETALENVVRKLYAKKYRDESGCELDVAIKEFGDEAMELLKLVGLDHKSDHLASVLSGGEKQRLIMARQLAKKPKVMLLDEPATMACPKTKQDILNAIKKINDELGITIIIVSHLPEIHKYLADRVILLKDGEIEKEGDAEEIIEEFLAPIDDVCDIEIKSSDETVIKAIDLNKKFILLHGGEVLDIRDISFEVKRHDILSLVGVSGAGKTILLRMLGGLDVPDSGDVLFELENYATIQEQLARKLGYKRWDMVEEAKKKAKEEGLPDQLLDALYQLTDLPLREAKARLEQVGLDPDILDELFPKFPETAVREEVEDLFEALDLPIEILHRKSYELSGGQKVRAMLAIVLASKPDILLLDEPFGDLDPITLRTVSNSLKRICDEFGTTIVMVSHNTDFIKELSNRAIFMDDGLALDDSKDVDGLVNRFIGFCNAEYLM